MIDLYIYERDLYDCSKITKNKKQNEIIHLLSPSQIKSFKIIFVFS